MSFAFLAILSYVVTETVVEVYVRSDLPILWTSSHHSLELLFVDIRLRQGNMLIGLFYRPPSAPVSIIDDLDAALSDIHPTRLSSTLLLGDFNINLLSATPNITLVSCL